MDVTHSLLYLILIIAAAKVGGEIAEYLGQPAVLGELLAGVALGTTVLRHASDDRVVVFVATIGIILLLFEVGLESELDEFVKVGKSATLVAVMGVILPLTAGFGLAYALIGDTRQALFLGATLTATSVGITARVLSDMRKTDTAESKIILGAAIIDDILGLLVLSVVLGITSSGRLNLVSIGQAIAISVVFLVGAIVIGIRYATRLVELAQHLRTRGILVSVSFLFCLTLAYLAHELGLAEIVGAFAAGLVLASTDDRVKIQEQIKPLADIFIPVFFVVVGLQVNLSTLNPLVPENRATLLVGLALFSLAVVTKLMSGLAVTEKNVNKVAVGVGMVPRGEVGLIFASVGQAAGILSPTIYAQVILIVFGTTLITPPWLKRVFAGPGVKVRRRKVTE